MPKEAMPEEKNSSPLCPTQPKNAGVTHEVARRNERQETKKGRWIWLPPCAVVAAAIVVGVSGCGSGGGGGGNTQATPSPSASGTPTPVPSASPTGFASPLPTPTPSDNPPTPPIDPNPTASPSPTASPVPSASPTVAPSPDPSGSPTPTPSPSIVPTPTPPPVPTPVPTPTPVPVAVVLSPDTVLVSPMAIQQFTPFVGNTSDLGITYGIVEGAAGGTITGDGLYTAPLTPGTYHLTVTSHADPTKSATATITVANRVTLTPDAQTVTLGDTLTFSASVPDVADQAVTWRILEAGGGSISAGGVYVAPRIKGTFHVIATSSADPTRSGVATIVVQAGSAKGGIE